MRTGFGRNMLSLYNIKKDYGEGETRVQALKGVTLHFRKSEFVSILGASGCGKTTLLNIIGGLDQYTSGDLVISGKSTKEYKDRDWDAYRNASIGFVFQSYNLIHHQTVLSNVELALTLSGVSRQERKERAIAALKEVGLESQIHKLPNQLSGGQMQRVAIARALVNDPEIILADEPTGALDTTTSVQIMELLKEIAKDRLIIMVTHNPTLAETYSTRIIRLVDGEVVDDSNPFDGSIVAERAAPAPDEVAVSAAAAEPALPRKREKKQKTAMSYATALSLSLKNLFTKKVRTFLIAFAGSIGIIGIALVLAISSGLNLYIDKLQRDTLSSYPLTISAEGQDQMEMLQKLMELQEGDGLEKFPSGSSIFVNNLIEKLKEESKVVNDIPHALEFLETNVDPDLYYAIQKKYDIDLNAYLKTPVPNNAMLANLYPDGIPFPDLVKLAQSSGSASTGDAFEFSSFWQEIVPSQELLDTQYDLLTGKWATEKDELVLLVDQYNRINDISLAMFGFVNKEEEYDFSDFLNREFTFSTESVTLKLKVVGIVRVNENTSVGALSSSTVLGYSSAFTQFFLESEGRTEEAPIKLSIYPKDFEAKEKIKTAISDYNKTLTEETKANKITVTDLMQIMVSMVNTFIDSVSYVLIAFTAVSLVVSSIMIGIITYISVLERTKEIGVLRALGARKKDISRVFNAETLVIGLIAGLFGVIVTYLLTIPINAILFALTEIAGLAQLVFWHALILIAISCLLTLVAGLIPSRIAAKKDPVVALRSE